MKTNIKMRVTPEQLEKICKIVGEGWLYFKSAIYMYIFNDGSVEVSYSKENWNKYNLREIDADLFIRTNGTCEEDTFNELFEKVSKRVNDFQIGNRIEPLDKYAELESKLKKKNEILKKARIKRKNQREELHKLNLKLQKCISLEEHNRKIESKNSVIKTIEDDRIFKYNMYQVALGEKADKLNEAINKIERDAKESIKDIKALESLNNGLKMENKSLKESSKISCNMLHSQKDKIDRLEFNYVIEKSNYKKEIEKLKSVIEYLESKVK